MSGADRIVVTDPSRTPIELVDQLNEFGVATIHEAQSRSGYLGTQMQARQVGVRVAGTAVTALCRPGDNLMIHAAVEQCQLGDLLVVTTSSPCSDGLFGELLATSLASRGVRGVVLTTGVRDVAELNRMSFPVWSTAVSAQGTVKASAGAVNVPVAIQGTIIEPGDVVVADDDGVVVVPRRKARAVLNESRSRELREQESRAALAKGVLGLDLYNLRPLLSDLGVTYVPAGHSHVE